MNLILEGAIANFSGLTNQQFLEVLDKNTNGFEFYHLLRRPGYVTNAALDWKAIGNVSSVLTIISFIWMVYEKSIEPNKAANSNAGIIIRIENSGNQNNYWIVSSINKCYTLFLKENNKIGRHHFAEPYLCLTQN